MPNFQKSKGFQLKSGNKANAPFKMIGSSPAKQSASFGGKLGVDIKTVEKTDVTKKFEAEQRVKKDLANKPLNEKQQKTVDKAVKSDNKFIEKASKRASKGKTTKPDKPGTVVSRAAKKVVKGAKNFGKAMQDPENQQKMRDLGAVVSNIGDPNTSMSSVIQGQADRKQDRVDKNIQNEKDKVSTARNKQIIDQHNKEASGEGKLAATNPTANPADTETAAEKVKKQREAKRLKMQEERASEYEENK